MALRVLLADDSATIKKVMQLSLSDFAVDLKAVSSGEDVLAAAKNFTPDIIFVDVLLPQKSGYDIANQIKKDPTVTKTPVVLLWSPFMDFDEGKYKTSGADEKLEKPFEAQTLRGLIHKYVPKTQESPVSKHLEFPAYDFDSMTGGVTKTFTAVPTPPTPPAASTPSIPATPAAPAAPAGGAWNMESFEDISTFSEPEIVTEPAIAPLQPGAGPGTVTNFRMALDESQKEDLATGAPKPAPSVTEPAPDSEWVRKDLNKFTVPVPQEMQAGDENTVSFQYVDKVEDLSFLLKPGDKKAEPAPAPAPKAAATIIPEIPTAIVKASAAASKPADKESTPKTEAAPSAPAKTPAVVPAPPAEEKMLPHAALPQIPTGELQNMLEAEIEKLVKEQAKAIVEKMVWKIVPDMAANLIKEEIQRLTKDNS